MKEKINTLDFLKNNLKMITNKVPFEVNLALAEGAKWFEQSEAYELLTSSLNNGVTWRVLINASEEKGKWKELCEAFPHELIVKECDTPLLHIYHSVKLFNEETREDEGVAYVKFPAFDKSGVLIVAGDELYDSEDEGYEIFDDEFEYLWEIGKEL